MADSVTVKVEGLQALGEAMRELSQAMNKKIMRSATRAAANVIMKSAQNKVPIKTGALRESIQTLRDRQSSYPGYEQAIVGVFKIRGGRYAKTRANIRAGRVGKVFFVDPPTYYGRFIEYGTVKMGARPYLRPAFQDNKEEAVRVMKDKIASGIEKANKLK